MTTLKLGHLYPKQLNIYGDGGNILSLLRRAQGRGLGLEITEVGLGEKSKSLRDFDILFIGGGQDEQQELVALDFLERRQELSDCLAADTVMLAICGGYQLLGHYYLNSHGEKTPGLGLIDLVTEAAPEHQAESGIRKLDRLVGNVVAELLIELSPENFFSQDEHQLKTLVGFENHSGRSYFQGTSAQALAKIIKGHGNNAQDGSEGANYRNLFCSYLHGSLLPKNPHLSDELLIRALKARHRGALEEFSKSTINNNFELAAHYKALNLT